MKNKSALSPDYCQLCYFEGTENKSPDTRINQTIPNKKDKPLEKRFRENNEYAASFQHTL